MDIKLDQVLFQIINFGVVAGALTVLLYKPILKMLEERAKKIEQAQKAAEESLREREEVEQMKKKAKLQTDREAAKLLEKAKEQAAEVRKELLQKAKDEAKADREKALQDWKLEKKGLTSQMQKEFAASVYAVTERLIGKSVDKKTHAELIDKSIKELAQLM